MEGQFFYAAKAIYYMFTRKNMPTFGMGKWDVSLQP
jgi:hypothetical protein